MPFSGGVTRRFSSTGVYSFLAANCGRQIIFCGFHQHFFDSHVDQNEDVGVGLKPLFPMNLEGRRTATSQWWALLRVPGF